jgi:hypothetical protein
MTRSSSSNTKYVWVSKLTCRRNETMDHYETGEKVLCSNESIETPYSKYPLFNKETDWSKKKRDMSLFGSYQTLKSIPMCSISCTKTDDDTMCSVSDRKGSLSNEWSINHETASNFGKTETCTVIGEGTSISCHSNENSHLKSSRHDKIINLEVLSPTLQLLHEVYIKKMPSATGVYFLPSYKYPLNETIHTRSGKAKCNDDNNQKNAECLVQHERMIFRQQMRYEAIKKELFDIAIDNNSLMEYKESNFDHEEYTGQANAIDVLGCHAVSLWNLIPNVDNFFLPALRENEIVDDGSENEQDSDDLSDSISAFDQQSLSTDETDSASCDNEVDDTAQFENEDVSNASSFMDQSHVYPITNARKEQAGSRKFQENNRFKISSTRGESISRSPGETIGDIGHIFHQNHNALEAKSSGYHEGDVKNLNCGITNIPRTSLEWVGHLQPQIQPKNKQQNEIDSIQVKWLKSIFQSFGNINDSNPAHRTNRIIKAQEALKLLAKNNAVRRRPC